MASSGIDVSCMSAAEGEGESVDLLPVSSGLGVHCDPVRDYGPRCVLAI